MTTSSPELAYGKLRAPQDDGGVVVSPSFEEVGSLLRANHRCRDQHEYDLQGRRLAEVSAAARRQLVAGARRWTSQYREVDTGPFDPARPILLAGHQPELFHPGVWLKDFALGTLAERYGGVGVNLVIDSDTLKTPGVSVPGGSVARPHVVQIPMDRAGPPLPYEERPIFDRQAFCDFGRRVAHQIAPLLPDPLIRDYWPKVTGRMHHTANLGTCLAQARHELEGEWGLDTLEIPQSWVCRMEPHGWFVAHLLAQLPRLRLVYNEVVEEYRRANRVRNRAHPVPNLAQEGEWLEAPFWIWTDDDPRRRPLFAARRGRQTALSDGQGLEVTLPLSPEGDAGRAVERLVELGREGVKIRSRALITTLWARLVLGDLFLHGIGGAKYDRVTDALVRRFFGLEPPRFLVLSATLHLPIAHQRTTGEDVRAIEHRLRELTYHPECYMNGASEMVAGSASEVAALVEAKARWVRTAASRENARDRHQAIRRINEALQPYVAPLRKHLEADRRKAVEARKADAILSSREYGFCLFPEKTLREFLVASLHKCERIGFDKA
jgi:hypothetical protein